MNSLANLVPATAADPAAIATYVEEVARYFEDAGLPRIAGRLIGVLMVAEPREQSAADLAHRLHASRASISTMGRLLISAGIVERWTVPGQRREYLRFRDDAWPTVMVEKTRWISELRQLGERGLRLHAGTDGPARDIAQRAGGPHGVLRARVAPAHGALARGARRTERTDRLMNVIETEKLTKSYGSHRGIIDVDLTVREGEVFGFLGPNGAGKTTTIRTLLDLIRPTSGTRARLRHRDVGRPGRDPPAGRLPARRVRPLRQAHGRPARSSTSPTCGAAWTRRTRRRWSSASTSTPRGSSRSTRKGNKQKVGPDHRSPAPPGPADPRRADGAASIRSSSRASSRRSARSSPRAGRSSSRATSSPRSRRAATGWRSSARGAW